MYSNRSFTMARCAVTGTRTRKICALCLPKRPMFCLAEVAVVTVFKLPEGSRPQYALRFREVAMGLKVNRRHRFDGVGAQRVRDNCTCWGETRAACRTSTMSKPRYSRARNRLAFVSDNRVCDSVTGGS